MKLSNLYVCVVFTLTTLAASANTNSNSIDIKDAVTSKIETYLSTIDYSHDLESVTIFSDFLVNENGHLYNIDFMINAKGDIVVLSKEVEEEFYKVNAYSTIHLVHYSFPVAYVQSN